MWTDKAEGRGKCWLCCDVFALFYFILLVLNILYFLLFYFILICVILFLIYFNWFQLIFWLDCLFHYFSLIYFIFLDFTLFWSKLISFHLLLSYITDRDGSVGIATGYGLDGQGIESPNMSVPVQTGPGAHPVSCTIGIGPFPRVMRPGSGVSHTPPSSAEVKRVLSYPFSQTLDFRVCYGVKAIPLHAWTGLECGYRYSSILSWPRC
jgi:hypothetical protein